MDFFGMGMGEILLILVIALVIWGPGRLTEIARTLGKVARSLRKSSFDLTTQLTKELEVEEKSHLPRPEPPSNASPQKPNQTQKEKSNEGE